MSEFVGRTGSLRVYSYPEPRRSGTPVPYARNYATGPKVATDLIDDTQIPWNSIDVPPLAGNVDVPITPQVTGVVLISGIVAIQGTSGSPVASVVIAIQVDGVSIPVPAFVGIAPLADGQKITIPFIAAVDLTVGVTSNIEIAVTGDGATLVQEGSVVEVEEVPVSTG